MKEHSNRQRQRQGYKEAETGGEKRDREESKNTLAHTSPPLSKIKTMYKPRRPARTQGRMASSSSLPPSRSLLSLSLFAFGQQCDHQPVDSRQKPTIPPENGRKKVGNNDIVQASWFVGFAFFSKGLPFCHEMTHLFISVCRSHPFLVYEEN